VQCLLAAPFLCLLQLLAGACELLGSTLNLTMRFTAAPAGTSWCEEAYIITVSDAQPQQRTPIGSSSMLNDNGAEGSSCSNQRQLGRLLLLFDSHYDGLPYTTTVR
jgi:hypothetical protein